VAARRVPWSQPSQRGVVPRRAIRLSPCGTATMRQFGELLSLIYRPAVSRLLPACGRAHGGPHLVRVGGPEVLHRLHAPGNRSQRRPRPCRRRTRWPQASRPRGSRPSSGTPPPRCGSRCTRASFRIARAVTAARCSRGWRTPRPPRAMRGIYGPLSTAPSNTLRRFTELGSVWCRRWESNPHTLTGTRF
jgi:hypothetical protein